MPILSAAGPRITFPELVERVKQIGHPPVDTALVLVNDARMRIGALGVSFSEDGHHFHVWQVGAAILAALVSVDGALHIAEAGPQQLARNAQLDLLTSAGGLATTSRIAEGALASDLERRRIILRTLCTRSSLQREFVYQFTLMLHLLGVWNVANGAEGDGYCEPLFRRAFDCSTREYAEMMFALWAIAAKSPVLQPSTWFTTAANGEAPRALLERIIGVLACPAGEIARRVREDFAKYEADGLVQAWFSQYPFVAAEDGFFVPAPLPFLRLAASSGAFYRALSLAREEAARNGSDKPWTNEYSSEMGRRFESYVRFILSKSGTPGDLVHDEYEYQRGSNALSPDFIMTSTRSSRTVLILQAKLKRLVPGAFYGFSLDDFRGDAEGPLAELVWKSLRYIHRIHTLENERLDDARLELHETIRQADSIILLGVVPTLPSLFHVDEFRSLIMDGATAKLNEQERAWFAANRGRFALWHVLDIEELCAFVAVRSEKVRTMESLADALKEYLTLPGFGDLARVDGILYSFRDWYITTRAGGRSKERIPELQSLFDDFCTATSRKLFPKPNM